MAFEAADGFSAALALVLFSLQVGAGRCVHPALRDRDPVERAVELAIAAAVETVALLLSGAGVERCDACVAGQLRV